MNSILVIEDDVEILDNIEEILESGAFQAITTSDSRRGVELAKSETPDLVICDVTMPDLDGFGVLQELRQSEATAVIPFIFLTGKTDRSDIRLGMELGANDYLTKPFTNDELIRSVQSCLKKQAQMIDKYEHKLQGFATLERQLQVCQEIAEIHSILLQKLSQGLRHPISNINIATYMLKQDLSREDFDRYISILEEECARGTSLLNEVASLQEYLHPSKINLLRGKLKTRSPL